MVKVTALDHFVLNAPRCRSLVARWYERVLGMTREESSKRPGWADQRRTMLLSLVHSESTCGVNCDQ